MSNPVSQLRRDNNRREKQLDLGTIDALRGMLVYFRAGKLCAYDLERVRADLIDRAEQAQKSGSSLEAMVGDLGAYYARWRPHVRGIGKAERVWTVLLVDLCLLLCMTGMQYVQFARIFHPNLILTRSYVWTTLLLIAGVSTLLARHTGFTAVELLAQSRRTQGMGLAGGFIVVALIVYLAGIMDNFGRYVVYARCNAFVLCGAILVGIGLCAALRMRAMAAQAGHEAALPEEPA